MVRVTLTALALGLAAATPPTTFLSDTGLVCRCQPGEACWPSKEEWSKLDEAVNGRLSQPLPLFQACADDKESAECKEVDKHSEDPFWLADRPSGYNKNGYLGLWNRTEPAYAVAAESVDDVKATVVFAKKHNIRLVVKNTGSEYIGRSAATPGSLMLWTHRMNEVTVEEDYSAPPCGSAVKAAGEPVAHVGAGAMWSKIYDEVIISHARFITGAVAGSVGGAGGFWMGAGYSDRVRTHGLAAGNILEAEVVLADGSVVTATECNENKDLFWALRGGGGGTFGVVTRVTYRTFPVPNSAGHCLAEIDVTDDTRQMVFKQLLHEFNKTLQDYQWGGFFQVSRNKIYINLEPHSEKNTEDLEADVNSWMDDLLQNAKNFLDQTTSIEYPHEEDETTLAPGGNDPFPHETEPPQEEPIVPEPSLAPAGQDPFPHEDDDADEDSWELRFPAASLASVDQEQFKRELLAALVSQCDAPQEAVDQVTVELREGSIIATLTGPADAMQELKSLHVEELKVMGFQQMDKDAWWDDHAGEEGSTASTTWNSDLPRDAADQTHTDDEESWSSTTWDSDLPDWAVDHGDLDTTHTTSQQPLTEAPTEAPTQPATEAPTEAKATCIRFPQDDCDSGGLIDSPDSTTCRGSPCTIADDKTTCCKATCATFSQEDCDSGATLIENAGSKSCAGRFCTGLDDKTTCCKASTEAPTEASVQPATDAPTEAKATCATFPQDDCDSGKHIDSPESTTCRGSLCTKADDKTTCCKATCATFLQEDCDSGDTLIDNPKSTICTGRFCTSLDDKSTCCKAPALYARRLSGSRGRSAQDDEDYDGDEDPGAVCHLRTTQCHYDPSQGAGGPRCNAPETFIKSIIEGNWNRRGPSVEATGYMYAEASWYIPSSAFSGRNFDPFVETVEKALDTGVEYIRFYQGSYGGKAEVLERNTKTSMHPRINDAVLIAQLIAREDHWIPELDADLRPLKPERAEPVNAAAQVFREAYPEAGAHINELAGNEPNWQRAQWGANYERLLEIKEQVDPQGVFVCRMCVGSEGWDAALQCRDGEVYEESEKHMQEDHEAQAEAEGGGGGLPTSMIVILVAVVVVPGIAVVLYALSPPTEPSRASSGGGADAQGPGPAVEMGERASGRVQ